jgi:hypothetical protein
MAASSRQAVGVEATGQNTSPWSRRTASSVIVSPPSGEHHRQVGGDPARIMPGPARPKRPERSGVRACQPGGIGKIRQQPCPGVTHPCTVSGDMELGTRTDTLHAESAFRLDRQNPSTRFIVPAQKALSRYRTETGPTPGETARLEAAAHIDEAFREAFPQWRDFRQAVADRARHPEFNERRALQQVLMSDLAHRITADQDLGWLLIGSLALPARPADGSWPADFRVPGITDIPQQYLMPRSAFDLDLRASTVTDPDPVRAARLYRDAVEGSIRRVAAPPDHAGTAHGIGLGGLVLHRR